MEIRKVIINDDHDAVIDSVTQVLEMHQITNIKKTQYCEDAFLKIKKSKTNNNDFDLLITDLSFKPDYREDAIESGENLIKRLRENHINIPIIVYSMKDQLNKVRLLINKYKINGYVCKDRKGSKDLHKAILALKKGEIFLSPQVEKATQKQSNLEIDDYDIELIQLLSNGLSQEEISDNFKVKKISPNSLSTIEKRLNKLKLQFKANNTVHLVSISKDLGLI